MNILLAIKNGRQGEKISRLITGTSDVSAGRSAIATGAGVAIGALATTSAATAASAVGATALATVLAPAALPVAIVSGGVALVFSLFD